MNIIETLEKEQLRADVPKFGPGDTVKVHAKIVEGTRERIQIFEGVVIADRVLVSERCLQFVVFPMVSALKECSLYIRRV